MSHQDPYIRYGGNEEWAIVAKKVGSARDFRAMNYSFGSGGSKDEMLHRIYLRLQVDPDFRRKWQGWMFVPVLISEYVEVSDTGAVRRHKNDVQPLVVTL